MLSIDIVPRAAIVLTIFEDIRIEDAATLLDTDAAFARNAQAIGLSASLRKLAVAVKPS